MPPIAEDYAALNALGINIALSVLVSRDIDAEPRRCFTNSLRALRSQHLRGLGARYVEGWAIMDVIPLVTEHAWVVLPDGSIVEPTLFGYSAYYEVFRWRYPLRRMDSSTRNALTFFPLFSHQRHLVRRAFAIQRRAYKERLGVELPEPRREARP